MNPNLHPVIGIDLGTTFSAVAAWNTALSQAVVIPDRSQKDAETTPSVIGLENVGQGRRRAIVGWDAKRNLPNDTRNTVIEIKARWGPSSATRRSRNMGPKVGSRCIRRLPSPVSRPTRPTRSTSGSPDSGSGPRS